MWDNKVDWFRMLKEKYGKAFPRRTELRNFDTIDSTKVVEANDVTSVAEEDDNIIEVGAVGYEFIFLQAGTDETLFAVDVQFLIGFHHFGRVDGVEVA